MLRLIVLITTIIRLGNTECPIETIEHIKASWAGKPPENVLKNNVGMVTYVLMSAACIEGKLREGLHCFATHLDRDEKTSTDVLIYTNRSASEVDYFQAEGNGIITLHYKYDPFVGISVKVSHLHSEETVEAVTEAINTLTTLGFKTGAHLLPCEKDDFKIPL